MSTVLIIDDQVGILQMLDRRLTKFGHKVFLATNQEDTQHILQKEEIELVLLDYMMPQVSGFDLFMEFHLKFDIPVIMMTAHSSIHLAIEFMKNGGVDFIEKPLDIDVLNLRIERAIKSAREFKEESLAKERAELALKVTNRALNEKTRILKIKNKELDAFAAAISHDLKAPARSISSFIGLLKGKLDLANQNPDIQSFFQFIEQGSKKMNMMISELLEMTKMEELNRKIELIHTNEVVERIVESIRNTNPEYKAQFLIKPLPNIIGDLVLIEQVFYNLIENAAKYSHGKPNPSIEISATKEQEKTVFAIKDNGVGFDMIYADRLFDMFVRLDTQDKFEGTGIGLANVKKIITRHNGEVWVESEKGTETTFYFSIPS